MMVYSIKSTNVLYGITIFNCLYPLEAIFKSVLLWHNKPPKVFCLTFGVQFIFRVTQTFCLRVQAHRGGDARSRRA